MARNRWQNSQSSEIPMTPLIDIVFILIIFFLVATTFYTEERDLKIELPEGTEGEAIEASTETFVINVRPDGALVVKKRVLSMAELETQLVALVKGGRKAVEIRGDTNTPHGKMMGVMNLCKKSGIANYSLTQKIIKAAPQ